MCHAFFSLIFYTSKGMPMGQLQTRQMAPIPQQNGCRKSRTNSWLKFSHPLFNMAEMHPRDTYIVVGKLDAVSIQLCQLLRVQPSSFRRSTSFDIKRLTFVGRDALERRESNRILFMLLPQILLFPFIIICAQKSFRSKRFSPQWRPWSNRYAHPPRVRSRRWRNLAGRRAIWFEFSTIRNGLERSPASFLSSASDSDSF